MPTLVECDGRPYAGRGRRALCVVFLSASAIACEGRIGEAPTHQAVNSGTNPTSGGGIGSGSSGGPGSASGGSGSGPSTPDCTNPAPGASPIRRLTRFEYSNAVREL